MTSTTYLDQSSLAQDSSERDSNSRNYPKLRSDLEIARTETSDGARYTLKQNASGDFFQIGEEEYLILSLMDGQRSLARILVTAERDHGLAVDAHALLLFLDMLREAGCLEGSSPSASKNKSPHSAAGFFKNALYLNRHVFNPDAFLEALEPRLGFFFSRDFLLLTVVCVLASLVLLYVSADQLTLELMSLGSVSGFVVLYLAAAVVTALHELAHGLTCKHFGGKVPSMGVLLILMFIPCFYTDVSDAWLFRKKQQRLWVTSAGVIFEAFLWSLAVGLWLITEVDSVIHQISLGIMVSSATGMFMSLNPLLKFDGYYLISDALEIPNLRDKSMAYFAIWLGSAISGNRNNLPKVTRREHRIYVRYGFAVLAFTFLVLGSVMTLVTSFVVERFGAIFSLPLAWLFWLVLSSLFTTLWTGFNIARGKTDTGRHAMSSATATNIHPLDEPTTQSTPTKGNESFPGGDSQNQTSPPRRNRGRIALAVIAALALLGYLVDKPLVIVGQAQLQPEVSQSIEPSIHGLIKEVYVREGSLVKAGDPLIKIDDNALRSELKSAEASLISARKGLVLLEKGTRPELIAAKRETLGILKANVKFQRENFDRLSLLPDNVSESQLMEAKHAWENAIKRVSVERNELALLLAGTPKEQIEAKQADILSLEVRREKLISDIANTEVLAPISGVIVTQDPESLIGKYTAQGNAVLDIQQTGALKAQIAVKERDVAEVRIGQPARLKVYGYPGKVFTGTVTHISSTVKTATINNIPVPAILVEASIDDPENLLKTGMNGLVRIEADQQSYLALTFRKVIHWFKIEFWL